MNARKLTAVTRSKTALHEGFLRVSRYQIEVEKHEGGTHVGRWEMMERGHAVAVLGHDPARDEVVLVNEFRPGIHVAGEYPFTDTLVAGVVDDGENVMEAAVREMQEEANLALREPILIHPGAYVSPGGTSEKIALVYGIVDTTLAGGVHGVAAEDEDLLTVVLSAKAFIDRIRRGDITDMKTLVAGYWFARRHAS